MQPARRQSVWSVLVAIAPCLAIHLAALAAPLLAADDPVEKPAPSAEKADAPTKDAAVPSPAIEKTAPDKATPGKPPAASPKSADSAKEAAAPNAPAAPKNALDDMPSYGEALIRMLVVLASILIALLLLARYLPRWLGKSAAIGRGDKIKVLDSLALEPRKRIYLVKVGEQLFLIGTSESGVHMLADKAIDAAKLGAAEGAGDAADPGVMGSGPGPSMRTFAEALGSRPKPRESEGA